MNDPLRLTPTQHRFLEAMDIQVWQQRARDQSAKSAELHPEGIGDAVIDDALDDPRGDTSDDACNDSWRQLQAEVRRCTRCSLSESRTQTVFGVGNPDADLMIVGEAPGGEEDRQGEPFVGRAGLMLNEMLAAVGLQRSDVFIANILKCRPPDNRDPRSAEVAACADFLLRQVSAVNPSLIIAAGRIAAHHLLDATGTLGGLRGRIHRYGRTEIPLIVTYHPAYLLRSPSEKRKSWEDLCLARSILQDTGQ